MVCIDQQLRDFLVGQVAYHFGGRPKNKATIRKLLTFGYQAVRTDQGVSSDTCKIQDHTADSDQAAVADRAAMDHGVVANRYIVANSCGHAFVYVNYTSILDVASFSDFNFVVVPSKHRSVPDTGLRCNRHRTDHDRVVGNEDIVGDVGRQFS